MRFVCGQIKIVVALSVALAGCASAPTRNATGASAAPDKPRATTDDYRRYIRGNVGAFDSSHITDWDSPDPNHVVVWTSPVEAYLLTLFGACLGLQSTKTILLSADGGVVRPGGAAVMVGPERCRIQLVDRLDAKAMKADGIH